MNLAILSQVMGIYVSGGLICCALALVMCALNDLKGRVKAEEMAGIVAHSFLCSWLGVAVLLVLLFAAWVTRLVRGSTKVS